MSATTLSVPVYASELAARPGVMDVEHDMLATLRPMGRAGRLWIASLLAICVMAFVAWLYQIANGLRVTDMRNYVSWGAYMTNFVFFIGISHAGTLISAILRVTDAGWRRPITRMAEAITVIALLVGASMVVIDMGRPDRVLNLIFHGRFQSPILWDLVSITTYITGSVLYLYVAMIPDMPILAQAARAAGRSPRLVRLYEALSLGFRETPEHRRRLARALGAMAVIIIPVAVSVHTVVSWIFGMTIRPGWHSTIFGPYFVIGAIFSGTAAIITAMALFRRAYHLERYLRAEHFHKLAKILLTLSLLYAYFTLSEYLTAWYGGVAADSRLLHLLAGNTSFGMAFWLWAAFGLFVPIALLLFPTRRSLASIVAASVLINIGMWVKRYLIIVPTLQTTYLPASAAGVTPHYLPSVVELTITAGAFAAFLLLFTLFSRFFPILSIWETAEDEAEVGVRKSSPVQAHYGRALAALAVTLMAGALTSFVPVRAARAQPPVHAGASAPVGSTNLRIAIRRSNEQGQDMLVGTITAQGRPVAGVTVAFSVNRAFGNMTLGTDQTLSDGSAAIPFPQGLPGNAAGQLRIHATIQAPAEVAGLSVEAMIPGGAPLHAVTGLEPRALWSTRTPLALVVTIGGLLLCVWSTFAFVAGQLVAMSHIQPEE